MEEVGSGKGLEAGYTFIIEMVWNKEIILERYLNSIEMGQGVLSRGGISILLF